MHNILTVIPEKIFWKMDKNRFYGNLKQLRNKTLSIVVFGEKHDLKVSFTKSNMCNVFDLDRPLFCVTPKQNTERVPAHFCHLGIFDIWI